MLEQRPAALTHVDAVGQECIPLCSFEHEAVFEIERFRRHVVGESVQPDTVQPSLGECPRQGGPQGELSETLASRALLPDVDLEVARSMALGDLEKNVADVLPHRIDDGPDQRIAVGVDPGPVGRFADRAAQAKGGLQVRGVEPFDGFPVVPCLVRDQHFLRVAAAGGVGLIVSQWAKLLGLTVIGTVSTEEKATLARAHGCDHTINYSVEDVAKRVREITDGVGVNVVFDSVGKTTFEGSLDSLKRRGLMVCVGTASGPVPPFNPHILARKGSLFLTRPALADYIADPTEKAELADEVFGHIAAGRIRIEINQRYTLEDAVQAHRDLESRKTTGSSIFVI